MDQVSEESEFNGPVLSFEMSARQVGHEASWRLTDSLLEDTWDQRLGKLDKTEDHKVRQEELDVFLVHGRVSPVEGFESEHGSGDESQALGDGQRQSEQVEGDKKDVSEAISTNAIFREVRLVKGTHAKTPPTTRATRSTPNLFSSCLTAGKLPKNSRNWLTWAPATSLAFLTAGCSVAWSS